jgi:hypothetical protein
MSMTTGMNWDTDELDTWIMNDEGLYNIALDLNERSRGDVSANEAENEIMPMVAGNDQIDVDYSEIDWDQIAESINEMHH